MIYIPFSTDSALRLYVNVSGLPSWRGLCTFLRLVLMPFAQKLPHQHQLRSRLFSVDWIAISTFAQRLLLLLKKHPDLVF